jgi:hypothetical protein
MHGRIDYESQVNIGTTFFFDLPLQATGVATSGNEFFTATGSVIVSKQKSA